MREVWLSGIDRMAYMHASIQATLYNAHFDNKGLPWTAEDLLGRGDREKRQRDRTRERMEVLRMNAKLGAMKPGITADGIPEWAKETVN